MHAKENYTPYLTAALLLTVLVVASFQLYIWREPTRIAGVEAHDKEVAVTAGQAIFKKNCTLCHGDNGEGTAGKPALNDKTFLASADDNTIMSIVGSGIPNTAMPAWGQAHSGPLTDEDIREVVVYIRSWEITAPDRQATAIAGDPSQGKALYSSICAVCHGKNGEGNDRGPKLNDPVKLTQFDDTWYKNTITKGRPAAGMPTWGTVLSPEQVANLAAFINTWRVAATLQTPTPVATAAPTSTVP